MAEMIFKSTLIASAAGTALALILAAAEPLSRRKFSAAWHYGMWLAVLAVMLVPVRITLPQREARPAAELAMEETVQDLGEAAVLPDIAPVQPIENTGRAEIPQTAKRVSAAALAKIWLTVALALFAGKIGGYTRFILRQRKGSHPAECPGLAAYTKRRIEVRISDSNAPPFLTGLLRPTLFLPARELTKAQLGHVLAHEVTHLHRGDMWFKWLACLAKCVHWFNPAVYFIARRVDSECEISCDLAVVSNMSGGEKREYAGTILSLATRDRAAVLTTGMSGNKRVLKRRFTMMKNKLKINKRVTVISVIAAVLVLSAAVFAGGIANGRLVKAPQGQEAAEGLNKPVGDEFNMLLLGLDRGERADAAMLVSLSGNKATAASIPRDTRIGDKRLSEIAAGGVAEAALAVQEELGVPISYYAAVDLESVKRFIDGAGGIEYDVPIDMEYDDPYQNLHISLKAGRQTLSGEQVCELLQYRRGYEDGDMSRITVGQQFLRELAAQKRGMWKKLAPLAAQIAENVDTNYPVERLGADVVRIEELELHTIPGKMVLRDDFFVEYQLEK